MLVIQGTFICLVGYLVVVAKKIWFPLIRSSPIDQNRNSLCQTFIRISWNASSGSIIWYTNKNNNVFFLRINKFWFDLSVINISSWWLIWMLIELKNSILLMMMILMTFNDDCHHQRAWFYLVQHFIFLANFHFEQFIF